MISVNKLRSGAALMKEILRSADMSRNDNGRVHKTELDGMLSAEGYSRDTMANSTRTLHRYAQRIAGGRPDPLLRNTDSAVRKSLSAIEKAAASDGNSAQLSSFEYEKLSPTAKALVKFSRKYHDSSIDELFF